MGLDLLDIYFRLEVAFGVRIGRAEFDQLFDKHQPPDVRIGELFDLVKLKVSSANKLLLDVDDDFAMVWGKFQQVIADSMGIEPSEVTKDRWLIQELGR